MDFSKLDRICERVRDTFGIPSLSAAFYIDGEYHSCYIGCDETTQFAIGSCTKSFSAGTVMALADDGLLSVDDKVKRWVKDLILSDAKLERELCIRDILCHRSGLPGCDFAWYPYHDDFTDADLMRTVSLLPKTAEAGEKYQYNNMMFALCGKVISECTETDWQEVVAQKIINSIGIKNYAFSSWDAEKNGPVAVPYVKTNAGIDKVPHAFTGAIGPAGSLYMNSSGLLKWNITLLHNGEYAGKQILSPYAVSQMEEGLISDESEPEIQKLSAAVHGRSYGLGLQLEYFSGEKLIYHGGAIDGFLASQSILPAHNCASVMLTNLGSTFAREAFLYAVNGYYLGDNTDWITLFGAAQKVYDRKLRDSISVSATQYSGADEDVLGCYYNPLFGNLEIFFDHSEYKARIGKFIMPAQLDGRKLSFWHVEFGLIESELIRNSEKVVISLLVPADPTVTRKFEFIKTEKKMFKC